MRAGYHGSAAHTNQRLLPDPSTQPNRLPFSFSFPFPFKGNACSSGGDGGGPFYASTAGEWIGLVASASSPPSKDPWSEKPSMISIPTTAVGSVVGM